MRAILRRVLIASWFIPAGWIAIFPLLWLMEGRNGAVNTVSSLSMDIWNGFDE